MHVRCPHCHNAIEIVGEDDLTQVTCPSCGSAFNLLPETATHYPTTRSIGHFQLLNQVGSGGFGSVWKARDTKLDRVVAIKIPRRDQVDPVDAEIFMREARAAAQLKHRYVVSVHEVGCVDGFLYIISDFIQGATLADRLTAGPFTPREAATLCAQIAEALDHAHELGVIHRDLKASNIMIDGDGLPHLLDFGLAKRESGEITITVDGKVLGTPAYMSPEQARGEGHHVDRRSDIYSLGVILFELLTGERPFRGNRAMLMHQVLNEDPPSPRKLNSRVPRDLETICLKCLQKSPARRYQTAEKLGDDLRRWLEGKPILARPVGRAERLVRWARRQPVVASLIATVTMVTLVGFAAVTWQWQSAKRNLDESERQRTRRGINFGRALEAVDQMLTHVGESELAYSHELAPIRRKILEDALNFYERLQEERTTDPDLRVETARAAMRVGAICQLLDDYTSAQRSYAQAISTFEELAKSPHGDATQLDLATCYYQLGHIQHYDEHRSAEAAVTLKRGLDVIRSLIVTPNDSNDELIVRIYFVYGCALCTSGNRDGGVATLREAVTHAQRPHTPPAAAARRLFGLYYAIAYHLDSDAGQRDEVEQLRRKLVALCEAEVKSHGVNSYVHSAAPLPSDPDPESMKTYGWLLGREYRYLAEFLRRTGREVEASEFDRKAADDRTRSIEELESVVAGSTSSVQLAPQHQFLAMGYAEQADLFSREGNTGEAATLYRKAIGIFSQLVKEKPSRLYYRTALLDVAMRLTMLSADIEQWNANYVLLKDVREQLRGICRNKSEEFEFDYRYWQGINQSIRDRKRPIADSHKAIYEALGREGVSASLRLCETSPDRVEAKEALAKSHGGMGSLLWLDLKRPAEAVPFYRDGCEAWERVIANHGLNGQRAAAAGWCYYNGVGAISLSPQPTAEMLSMSLRTVELREHVIEASGDQPGTRAMLEESYERVAWVAAHWPTECIDADLQRGSELSRARVGKDPSFRLAWRALGATSYRRKEYQEAVNALLRCNESELPNAVYDRLFLAMSLAKTGKMTEAKEALDSGSKWLLEHRPKDPRLNRFKEEAATIVGGGNNSN